MCGETMGIIQKEKGRENERIVFDYFGKRGYQVLWTSEKGFPYLVVLRDKQIIYLVEVRSWTARCPPFKEKYHDKLRKEGFETKVIYVKNGRILDPI